MARIVHHAKFRLWHPYCGVNSSTMREILDLSDYVLIARVIRKEIRSAQGSANKYRAMGHKEMYEVYNDLALELLELQSKLKGCLSEPD